MDADTTFLEVFSLFSASTEDKGIPAFETQDGGRAICVRGKGTEQLVDFFLCSGVVAALFRVFSRYCHA